MSRNKDSVWQGFLDSLNLPSHTLIAKNHIELFEQKKLLLQEARRIIEYDNEQITLLLREKKLQITGKGLKIISFVDKYMVIEGEIHALRFE